MRRTFVAGLAACLAVGALVAPATARKKPRPVRFDASGAIATGYPGDFAAGVNVTRNAFLESCATPPTQGLDGYVIELPAKVSARAANVTLTGADLTGLYDVDMHFFDESCAPNGALSSELSDEFGLMPEGTRYVLVTAFSGVEITFTFAAEGV